MISCCRGRRMGVKSDVCELYKLLHNPLRLEMLRRIYASRDGMNVGLLVDAMTHADVKQPCVSQYLKQLEHAGVIMRRRAGKYVNYFVDKTSASVNVRKAVGIVLDALRRSPKRDFTEIFGVMMNPFRAAVVCAVARKGRLDTPTICDMFAHQAKYLRRDLCAAVDAGLLLVDDDDAPTYRYVHPADGTVAELIALCS